MNHEELKKLLFGRSSARLIYRKSTKEILGLFYDWRKENPNESIMAQSDYGTLDIGKVSFPYSGYKDVVKELGLEEIEKEMIDVYNAKQRELRKEAEKIAIPLLDQAEAELNGLELRLGVTVSHSLDGDTYGVDSQDYISITVNGFDFTRSR